MAPGYPATPVPVPSPPGLGRGAPALTDLLPPHRVVEAPSARPVRRGGRFRRSVPVPARESDRRAGWSRDGVRISTVIVSPPAATSRMVSTIPSSVRSRATRSPHRRPAVWLAQQAGRSTAAASRPRHLDAAFAITPCRARARPAPAGCRRRPGAAPTGTAHRLPPD